MTDNVFGEQPTPAATTPPTPSNVEDLLKNIKNENGEPKYRTLEDAIIALDHSQKYIPQLKHQLSDYETRLAEQEQKVDKFMNIEESVQRLLAQQQNPPAVTPPAATGLGEQDVIKLVQESLNAERVNATLSSNQNKVNDALVSKFGEKAKEALEAKAIELGTTRQALGELAKQNPDIVLALFATPPSPTNNPSVSSLRTPPPKKVTEAPTKPERSLLSGPGANRTEQGAYFSKLREEKYKQYGIDS